MAVTSVMFDTPETVYQSANINHMASQWKGWFFYIRNT